MDDTLLFIPPCCVDKKLPKAVSRSFSAHLLQHRTRKREGFIVLIEYHVRGKTAHISIVSIEDFLLILLQLGEQ